MSDRSKWHKQVRVKLAGEIGVVWPETVQLLMEHYDRNCADKGLVMLKFKVDGLPISLNHMYEKGEGSAYVKAGTPGAFQDKSGRWRKRGTGPSHRLRQEVIDWRIVVMEAMGELRWKWKPTGVTAAMLLFESPYWITGRRTIREMDADNKTKPALDAVQHATEVPDELHWQIHVFKLLSKRQRTTIFLYDLGDIVEHYY